MDWLNKRVMVTGSDGFIGGALAETLQRMGADVTGYDILSGNDVLDYKQVRRCIEVNEIEMVYHLAAQSQVPIANKYPFGTLETNILGTLNVVDICTRLDIPCVVASSDKAYGEAEKSYDANTELNAKYPYDVSKACADKIAQVFIDRGAKIKVMRLCNVYGPGDNHRHRLIPHLISSYLRDRQPVIRGEPSMVRSWIYITDAVNHYIDIIDKDTAIFAFGGVQLAVYEVVDTIRLKMGGRFPALLYNADGEIRTQVFKIRGTGIYFEDGIDKTIAWWKEQPDDCTG